MAKGRPQNYDDLEKYLEKNDIEYTKLSSHHYRVLGEVSIVDVWPSRMTVHVIATEATDPNRYFKLDKVFNEEQFSNLINKGVYNG